MMDCVGLNHDIIHID